MIGTCANEIGQKIISNFGAVGKLISAILKYGHGKISLQLPFLICLDFETLLKNEITMKLILESLIQ